jgi:hypothetical protein
MPIGAPGSPQPTTPNTSSNPVAPPTPAITMPSNPATPAMPGEIDFGAVDLGFVDAIHGMPTGWTTAVPGRPSGVGIPASNVALPGGVPAPGPMIPSSPSVPFMSVGESTANTAIGDVGVTPPIGGAGLQKPSSSAVSAPDLERLSAPMLDVTTNLVDQPAPSVPGSTMPSPNQAPVPAASGGNDTAAPPTAGPFGPTSFDDWNGFG